MEEPMGTVELIRHAREKRDMGEANNGFNGRILKIANDLEAFYPHMREDGIAAPATMDFLARLCYGGYGGVRQGEGIKVGKQLLSRANAELMQRDLNRMGIRKTVEQILGSHLAPKRMRPSNLLQASKSTQAHYFALEMERKLRGMGIYD